MLFHIFSCVISLNPVVLCLFVAVAFLFLWNRIQTRLESLPGPTRWPILGNIPDLAFTKQMYLRFLEFRQKYGDIVQYRLGPTITIVVVCGHKNIQKLLVENADKTKFRPNWIYMLMKMFDCTGVIWSNGDHWHEIRKFTIYALKDFGLGTKSLEDRIREEADVISEMIRKYHGKVFNMADIMPKAVSNIISTIVFGERFDYDDPDFSILLERLDFIMKNAGYQRPENFFPILEKLLPFSKLNKIFESQGEIDEYVKQQIKRHEETFEPDNIRDFIDLYISNKSSGVHSEDISEKSLFRIIFDLYAAGSETTSTTLLWIVLYLIKYPKVQIRCAAEIRKTIGYTREVHMTDRENMPFVTATINEIQRISSIGPLSLPHACLEDVEIDGKVIPKNSLIIPHIMSAHYDENYWTNPREFKPERFIDKDRHIIKHEAFYPFSLGPRACMGKNLAEMELFIFTCSLLQKFSLSSDGNLENVNLEGIQSGVTLLPPPYRVKAIPRKL